MWDACGPNRVPARQFGHHSGSNFECGVRASPDCPGVILLHGAEKKSRTRHVLAQSTGAFWPCRNGLCPEAAAKGGLNMIAITHSIVQRRFFFFYKTSSSFFLILLLPAECGGPKMHVFCFLLAALVTLQLLILLLYFFSGLYCMRTSCFVCNTFHVPRMLFFSSITFSCINVFFVTFCALFWDLLSHFFALRSLRIRFR